MEQSFNVRLDGTNQNRLDERCDLSASDQRKRRKWKGSKGKFRAFTSNLSQGCMVVVAVLPLAGIFLGVGSAISSHTSGIGSVIGSYMANLGSFIFANLQILFAVAIAIAFTNQAPIAAFSAVVATLVFNGLQTALINPHYIYPMVKGHEQPTIDYCNVLFWKQVPASVFASNAGIYSMSSSVFGGIIVASVVVFFYNRFHAIKLPDVINFFGGTRFVPIITSFAMIPVSLLMCVVWPGIGIGLSRIGGGMGTLAAHGNVNALIFGYIERALVPFGVHHAFYTPLWYTSVGGDMTPSLNQTAYIFENGAYHAITNNLNANETWEQVFHNILGKNYDRTKFVGDQTLWMTLNQICGHKVRLDNGTSYLLTFKTFTQSTLNHPAAYIKGAAGNFTLAFPGVNPGQYEQGKYPFMMFGLPAAGAAMILAAPKQNRKFATSMIAAAAGTSFLTGITEPIEFTFLFLSPLLFWGVHASLCAISFWLSALLGANVGMTFSGSVIDFCIYGVLPDALGNKTNSWILPLIGIVYVPIYFFLFYWWVTHFNLSTPGRGAARLFTKKDYLAKKDQKQNKINSGFTKFDVQAYHVLKAVGGLENVENFNACMTKLRILTKNIGLVDKNVNTLLTDLGARGVQKQGAYVMAVFGFDADLIASSMRNIASKKTNFNELKAFVESNDEDSYSSGCQSEDSTKSCSADKIVVYSPLAGKVVSLAETEDFAFSEKVNGDGSALIPSEGHVKSPFDGEVKVAFPSGHAYVISHNGVEVMIHIGIDTVNINNERKPGTELLAFTPKVKVNEAVKAGDLISEVDLDYLKKHNYKSVTPVIAVNESISGYELKVLVDLNSTVEMGTPIFELIKK